MGKRHIAVSQLADFASDPDGFVARAGAPRNRRAANAGIVHHKRLGRDTWSPRIGFLVLLAALILVALAVAWFTGS